MLLGNPAVSKLPRVREGPRRGPVPTSRPPGLGAVLGGEPGCVGPRRTSCRALPGIACNLGRMTPIENRTGDGSEETWIGAPGSPPGDRRPGAPNIPGLSRCVTGSVASEPESRLEAG